jgi:hypothetical protein
MNIYRTHAIITLGLYIFYPIFEDHFFIFKEGYDGACIVFAKMSCENKGGWDYEFESTALPLN